MRRSSGAVDEKQEEGLRLDVIALQLKFGFQFDAVLAGDGGYKACGAWLH